MAKNNFNKQFRGGYIPQEPISPLGPIYREADAPSESRKRMGIQIGSAAQARPGLSGMGSRKPGPSGNKAKRSSRGK